MAAALLLQRPTLSAVKSFCVIHTDPLGGNAMPSGVKKKEKTCRPRWKLGPDDATDLRNLAAFSRIAKIPEWCEKMAHRRTWDLERKGKHKWKGDDAWRNTMQSKGISHGDDHPAQACVSNEKFFDGLDEIRMECTQAPIGFHPSRSTTMVNGRPVQILVLTHEEESRTARMPYMTAASGGCPVLLMWGRCAKKEPSCKAGESIWYWFMD